MSLWAAATGIEGVCVVNGRRVGDSRGFLERLFCRDSLAEVLGDRVIVQINHTRTIGRGTVRGMHVQHPPFAEMKLVHCLSGRIFDVAADLRAGSSTRNRWHGEMLSGDEPKTLVIPEGVAHGFQLLSEACDLIYFHTARYAPESEGGVNACDPALAIDWPLDVGLRSERDRVLPALTDNFAGINL